jgi:hypothetical protein
MLEALAAVSLAGNVLQFIEFLAKLVSKSSEIRRHGTTVTDEEIETTMTDLIHMAKELEDPETVEPTAATAITKEDYVRNPLFSVHSI